MQHFGALEHCRHINRNAFMAQSRDKMKIIWRNGLLALQVKFRFSLTMWWSGVVGHVSPSLARISYFPPPFYPAGPQSWFCPCPSPERDPVEVTCHSSGRSRADAPVLALDHRHLPICKVSSVGSCGRSLLAPFLTVSLSHPLSVFPLFVYDS